VNTVTPELALEHYAALGDTRNIQALETRLRDQGFACSRTTLTKWRDTLNWEAVAPRMARDAAIVAQGKALVAMSEDMVTVEGFERCLQGLEGLTEDIIVKVRNALATVTLDKLGDVLDLARAARDTAQAVGNIRAKIGEAAKAATKGETNISNSNVVMADPKVLEAIARASGRGLL
jgi:hypothetical protein